MASKVHKRGAKCAEMNMTPLIDVTFQLIIFFMLVNNIISEETVEMIIPQLEDPKVVQLDEGNRLTINIMPSPLMPRDRANKENYLEVPGDSQMVKLGASIEIPMAQLQDLTRHLVDAKRDRPNVEIILRADAATNYDAVQPVMEAITAAGISRVNLMAYLPQQGPRLKSP